MKKIIFAVVGFCVALMPSQILGNDALIAHLNEMAQGTQLINGVFKPSENGYLGKGPLSIVYKGKLWPPTDVEIAMKFTLNSYEKYVVREYDAYTYLKAIGNATVEDYGIPSVSYYGSWKNYILIAITLLESVDLKDRLKDPTLRETDFLMVCREFVRTLKYIHSHGVLHNNIHLGNILFRGNRVFVIDFSGASKLYGDGASGSTSEASGVGIQRTRNDLEVFISYMEGAASKRNFQGRTMERIAFKIEQFSERYETVYYDLIFHGINREINRIDRSWTGLFSWLTDEQRLMARSETVEPIESLSQPSVRDNFPYPAINYNYFA